MAHVSRARSSSASPQKTSAAGNRVMDCLTGRYRFVGGERESRAWQEAIEDVVVEMDLTVRGMARKRLLETNRIASEITLERRGNELTIRFDDQSYSGSMAGHPARAITTADGVRLSHRVEDGQLEQIFEGEDGGRINTFCLEPDGRIRLRVRVFSDRLPRELRYQLSYEK